MDNLQLAQEVERDEGERTHYLEVTLDLFQHVQVFLQLLHNILCNTFMILNQLLQIKMEIHNPSSLKNINSHFFSTLFNDTDSTAKDMQQ